VENEKDYENFILRIIEEKAKETYKNGL